MAALRRGINSGWWVRSLDTGLPRRYPYLPAAGQTSLSSTGFVRPRPDSPASPAGTFSPRLLPICRRAFRERDPCQ